MQVMLYDQTVQVECVDNGKIVQADVIRWSKDKFLIVALNTIKLNLQYNHKKKMYVGGAAGLEFQSIGPI
jgi:hypothetical protein